MHVILVPICIIYLLIYPSVPFDEFQYNYLKEGFTDTVLRASQSVRSVQYSTEHNYRGLESSYTLRSLQYSTELNYSGLRAPYTLRSLQYSTEHHTLATMAERTVQTLTKLYKRVGQRRTELKKHLESQELTHLLEPEPAIASMRPKTRLSSLKSQQKLLTDKYKFYSDAVQEIIDKINTLENVCPETFKEQCDIIEKEEDDAFDFRLRLEGVISQLSVKIEEAEDNVHDDVGLNGFQDHSLIVREREHKMRMEEAECKRAEREQERLEREQDRLERESEWKMQHEAPSGGHRTSGLHGIKLAKTELPKFGGDPLQWLPFHDAFVANIHNDKYMANHAKLTQLRSLLIEESIPARMLETLACTDANYSIAFNQLCEKYGGSDRVSKNYRKHMEDLPPATMDPLSLETTQVQLESSMQALEALGEDLSNDRSLRLLIMSKFPPEVYVALDEKAEIMNEEITDMSFLREALKSYVMRKSKSVEFGSKLHEVTHGITTMLAGARGQSQGQGQVQSRGNFPGGFGRGGQSQGYNSAPPGSRRVRCSYCAEGHFSDSCTKYKTIDSRMQLLKEQQRCFLCLNRSHAKYNCPNKRMCYHCSDYASHHRSLCPKRFPQSDGVQESKSKPPTQSQPPTHVHLVQNTAVKSISESSEVDGVSVNVVKDERGTLLQVANASIRSIEHPDQPYANITAMMDSGAQVSFILESVAKEVGILPHTYKQLELLTFSSDKGQTRSCGIANIHLRLITGEIFPMEVVLVPFICRDIRVASVPHEVVQTCSQFDMAHDVKVPPHYENISMLIGVDYFWEICRSGKEKVSKGLYLVETGLGWTLVGRVGGSDENPRSNPQVMSYLCVAEGSITHALTKEVASFHIQRESAIIEADGRQITDVPKVSSARQDNKVFEE